MVKKVALMFDLLLRFAQTIMIKICKNKIALCIQEVYVFSTMRYVRLIQSANNT